MAKDLYGTFGGVPQGDASAGPDLAFSHVTASPDAFGAKIGEAMQYEGKVVQKIGEQENDLAVHYAQQATEAKANDTIANQWAPAAAKRLSDYQALSGPDKIAGYDNYISGLRQDREALLKNATSPYEHKILDSHISSSLATETISAQRQLGDEMKSFQDSAQADLLLSEGRTLENHYNDPTVVADTFGRMDAQIEKHAIDNGLNPYNPADKEVITQQQRQVKGAAVTGMVNRAVSSGDLQTGYDIYHSNRAIIPGYQQLALDTTLNAEAVRQNGKNFSDAIINGEKLPGVVGAPPSDVQAHVVRAAYTSGVDPNQALTVAQIESAMGTNVGTRGDIGQTGKGGDLPEQAANMTSALKTAQDKARSVLGREPEPWENYVVYQQGVGGGPALFKGATENPTARAVDVLKPLYDDPKDAYDAVVNNGGNASMTSGQFLDFLKKKYQENSKYAVCTFTNPSGAAEQISKPHETDGIAMQPAASPRQQLVEFDKIYSQALLRANEIPNVERREGVIRALTARRSVYAASATAYSSTLINQAQELANDKNFTSLDQVPPDLASALLDEHPDTMHYLEVRAEYNLQKGSGGTGKYIKEYGGKYYDLFRRIHAPDGTEGKINSVDDLYSYMNENADLTPPGLDQLTKEFSRDPETDSEGKMRDQAFKVIKRQLSGQDEMLGIPDPKGEELFARALPVLYKAIDDGRAKGLSIGQMTDPGSPDWIGSKVASLKRSPEQMNLDMMNAVDGVIPGDKSADKITPQQWIISYRKAATWSEREMLRKKAVSLGFIRDEGPAVKLPGDQ